MCTVTFVPRKRGYALGMNRDEKLTREIAVPPIERILQGRKVIYPSEKSGGTWIALNDCGATLALINWYSIQARVKTNSVSRGEVVKVVSTANMKESADRALETLPLKCINPFRLIGIFPESGEIVEWRWNLRKLVRKKHRWRVQQWISSGFDEPQAQRVRSQTFRAMQKQSSAGTVAWLRRLHASHSPESGPFSTCMHRADAATVSYTEIIFPGKRGEMRYFANAPCQCKRHSTAALQREK